MKKDNWKEESKEPAESGSEEAAEMESPITRRPRMEKKPDRKMKRGGKRK